MQTYAEKESDHKKEFSKRPNSGTRFPKKMPSYIVAFSLGETFDDPPTTQALYNTQSYQNSFMSVSSGDSTKTIINSNSTHNSLQQLTQVINIPETTHDTIIDMIDPAVNQHDYDSDLNLKKNSETNVLILETTNSNQNVQPQILYDASKQERRSKATTKKRPKKRPVKIRNIYFKNKKNPLSKKIDRYCLNSKKSNINSAQIQKDLYCDSISQVVSRLRILKKVHAKENLLDGPNPNETVIEMEGDTIELESITSATSDVEKIIYNSDSSRSTLINKNDSVSSRPEDFYCNSTSNSVVEVASKRIVPFQTNMNIAVAVTYTPTMITPNMDRIINNLNEFRASLTSTETIVAQTETLTSTQSAVSKIDKDNYLNSISLNRSDLTSDITLVADQQSMSTMSSEYDNFVIAKTSSDFKSSRESAYTETSNPSTDCEKVMYSESLNPMIMETKTVLTGNTENRFSKYAPKNNVHENSIDNVDVVAPGKPNILLDKLSRDIEKKTNVFKKIFTEDQIPVSPQKNIILPNGSAIKALIEDKQTKVSCSDESRNNYPSTLPELWDRLVFILDLAMKRLEVTLANKILTEIKNISNSEINLKKDLSKTFSHKTVLVNETKCDDSKCVQCNLVHNTIIDQLMVKLSVESEKYLMPSSSNEPEVKLKDPKLLKDYFEILKPPLKNEPENDVFLEETITTSTVSPETNDLKEASIFKMCAIQTFRFIHQNLLVLSSFPAFLLLLVFAYTSIALLSKF